MSFFIKHLIYNILLFGCLKKEYRENDIIWTLEAAISVYTWGTMLYLLLGK